MARTTRENFKMTLCAVKVNFIMQKAMNMMEVGTRVKCTVSAATRILVVLLTSVTGSMTRKMDMV